MTVKPNPDSKSTDCKDGSQLSPRAATTGSATNVEPAKTRRGPPTAMEWCLGILLVLLLLILPFWCLMDYIAERRISQIEPAGDLIGIQPVGGWNSNALITTTTGFYTVTGDVAFSRGMHFQLETRDNDAHFLCDPSRKFCARVIGRGLKATTPAQAGSTP